MIGAGEWPSAPILGQAGRRTAAPPREDLLGTLTPRETQVLHRIVAGQSTGQMALEMDVAISTLRSYIKNILSELGVHSRLQAAAIASRASTGLVNRLTGSPVCRAPWASARPALRPEG